MHKLYFSIPLHFTHLSISTSVSCGRNDINDNTLTMKVARGSKYLPLCETHVACALVVMTVLESANAKMESIQTALVVSITPGTFLFGTPPFLQIRIPRGWFLLFMFCNKAFENDTLLGSFVLSYHTPLLLPCRQVVPARSNMAGPAVVWATGDRYLLPSSAAAAFAVLLLKLKHCQIVTVWSLAAFVLLMLAVVLLLWLKDTVVGDGWWRTGWWVARDIKIIP
jgi:uncharacterized protein YggT (Ycf19 family)